MSDIETKAKNFLIHFCEAIGVNILKIIGSRKAVFMIWENLLATWLIYDLADPWARVVTYGISLFGVLVYGNLINVEPVKASVNIGVGK